MTQINTPVGKLVQGKMSMQQRKDMKTNQPKVKADGTPDMGIFFSMAFPKLVNGAPNAEFNAFYVELVKMAAAAWPQFFPNGAQAVMGGGCSNPKFSWKYQDGDGTDTNGQSVADKPGFKGHHIVKFDTDYPVRCFNEGKFAAHEELQNADTVIKRGYWIRVFAEVRSNNADISAQQVPGISIYPNLVSFIGGRKEDEIVSGPDAMTALGGVAVGWRPDNISAVPGAPVGVAIPGSTGLALPTSPSIVVVQPPQYVIKPEAAAQGHTLESLNAQGHTNEQLLAAGYVTLAPVVTATPTLAPLTPTLAPLTPSLAPLGAPQLTPLGAPAGPKIMLVPAVSGTGATIDSLKALGWTEDMLVSQGHATRIG